MLLAAPPLAPPPALAERLGKTKEAAAPGAGAAGGLGFGMLAFFGAALRPGVDIVIDAVALRERLAGADLCITGEGRLDASSLTGKAPVGVARLCKEVGVPCVALVGSAGDGAGGAARVCFTRVHAIQDAGTNLEDAMRDAAPRLTRAAREAVLFDGRGG